MREPSETAARIWAALRRIEARGGAINRTTVHAELVQLHGTGGSFREITPVVGAWKREQLAKGETRIVAAVAAMAALATDLERSEVSRRLRRVTPFYVRFDSATRSRSKAPTAKRAKK
jgi:hypothetical protein